MENLNHQTWGGEAILTATAVPDVSRDNLALIFANWHVGRHKAFIYLSHYFTSLPIKSRVVRFHTERRKLKNYMYPSR